MKSTRHHCGVGYSPSPTWQYHRTSGGKLLSWNFMEEYISGFTAVLLCCIKTIHVHKNPWLIAVIGWLGSVTTRLTTIAEHFSCKPQTCVGETRLNKSRDYFFVRSQCNGRLSTRASLACITVNNTDIISFFPLHEFSKNELKELNQCVEKILIQNLCSTGTCAICPDAVLPTKVGPICSWTVGHRDTTWGSILKGILSDNRKICLDWQYSIGNFRSTVFLNNYRNK